MPHDPLTERFPNRATSWQLRARKLEFGVRPLVMGVVNVTPDSFSDGGSFFDPTRAIAHGLRLIEEGADLLDIGGESTRPYATPVSIDEELRRVMPVIEGLSQRTTAILSIDTSKAAVAAEALDAGAEIINDITGLLGDPGMVPLAVASKAGVCAMHMQGTPQTMQDSPRYDDVVRDIFAWLAARRDVLLAAGIESSRLCLDPGIGFGKTHQHNLDLVAGCGEFHALGAPLLVGASRKGFIGKVLRDKSADRAAGTIGVTLTLARHGVQIVRVHDVAAVRQALLLFEATGGIDGQTMRLD